MTGCAGDCHQGRAPCDCETVGEIVGMWDDEAAHPWRAAALYTAVVGGAILVSHLYAVGIL